MLPKLATASDALFGNYRASLLPALLEEIEHLVYKGLMKPFKFHCTVQVNRGPLDVRKDTVREGKNLSIAGQFHVGCNRFCKRYSGEILRFSLPFSCDSYPSKAPLLLHDMMINKLDAKHRVNREAGRDAVFLAI